MKFKLREFILSVCVVIMAAGNMASAQSIVPRKDDKKGQWGYVSTASGKWVVKPKYDAAAELTSAPNGQLRAAVTLKGKTGFVDDNGKLLGAGAVFEEVTPLEGNAMFVTVKGKKGVVNYDGVYLVKPEIIDVAELPGEGYLVSVKDKKGILKYDGTWLLDPLYKEIDTSVPDYIIVNLGNKAGLAKRNGSFVVAPKDFTGMKPVKGDYWSINKGAKTGLIDVRTGSVIIKPDYDEIVDVYLNGKAFLLRKGKKNEVLNTKGLRSFRFSDDLESVKEIPGKNVIVFNFTDKTTYICDAEQQISCRVNWGDTDFHGFKKTICSPIQGHKYTKAQESLISSLTDDYYHSPYGETKYSYGKNLGNGLFYMRGRSPKSVDLFKIGSFVPIGSVAEKPDGVILPDVIELTSGEYIDRKGEPVEIMRFNDKKNVAYKNLSSGKYTLISDALMKIGDKEYDMLKILRQPQSFSDDFVYVGSRAGKSYLLNSNGSLISESTADSPLEMEVEKHDYLLLIDQMGNIGLKVGGKVVIEPAYDDISMLELYDQDQNQVYYSGLYKVSKDGKMGLYDVLAGKMVIPIEKGYTSVGGKRSNYKLKMRLYNSGLCYVQDGKDAGDNTVLGIWNMKTGKELVAPASDNEIVELPKGYNGFMCKGVAYDSNGKKLSLPAAVDVYQAEWANSAPHFFVKLAGLKGRTVEFYITAYRQDGSVYRDRYGDKCIYKFEKTETPVSEIEYGPKVTAYLGNDVHLSPFSKITLDYVLSAKDAKTGASIPVKGEKTVTAWFSRDW